MVVKLGYIASPGSSLVILYSWVGIFNILEAKYLISDIMSDHAKLSAELAINAREEFFQDAQNAKNHDKNIVKVGSALLELDPQRVQQ